MSQDLRDGMIHNAVETRRARDIKIMQGVNQAHREAFVVRLPGQIEHSMRLIAERLIACLAKPEGTHLEDPATWPASADEIHSLTQSLWQLEQLRLHWPIPEAV
jgi:hypothetical protein